MVSIKIGAIVKSAQWSTSMQAAAHIFYRLPNLNSTRIAQTAVDLD